MKKRVVSFLLAVVIFILPLSGCLSGLFDRLGIEHESGTQLTRADWISLLCASFGMTEYPDDAEQRFRDVDESDELYQYVQAADQWGVFDDERSVLMPYRDLTLVFALHTAVRASSVDFGDDIDEYITSPALFGGYSRRELHTKIDEETAQNILDWAVSTYLTHKPEEKYNAVLTDGTIDTKNTVSYAITGIDAGYYVPDKYMNGLSVGDVMILYTEDAPGGIAVKITQIGITDTDVPDGMTAIITEEPDISEVYDAVDAVTMADEIDYYAFIPEEGVTVVEESTDEMLYNGGASIDTLVYTGGDSIEKTGSKKEFKLKVTFGEDQIKLNESFGDPLEGGLFMNREDINEEDKISIAEYLRGAPFKLSGEDGIAEKCVKYDQGWEVTGELCIKNISAVTSCDYTFREGLKRFSVMFGFEDSISVSYAGVCNAEAKLGTMKIQTNVPGITLNVDFFLFFDANGDVSIGTDYTREMKIEYKNGTIRKTSESKQVEEYLKGAIDIYFGFGAGITMNLVGLGLFGMKVKVGLRAEFSVMLEHKTIEDKSGSRAEGLYLSYDIYLTAPVIVFEGSSKKTLAYDIGIKFKYTLMDNKEHNPLHPIAKANLFHMQWLLSGDDIADTDVSDSDYETMTAERQKDMLADYLENDVEREIVEYGAVGDGSWWELERYMIDDFNSDGNYEMALWYQGYNIWDTRGHDYIYNWESYINDSYQTDVMTELVEFDEGLMHIRTYNASDAPGYICIAGGGGEGLQLMAVSNTGELGIYVRWNRHNDEGIDIATFFTGLDNKRTEITYDYCEEYEKYFIKTHTGSIIENVTNVVLGEIEQTYYPDTYDKTDRYSNDPTAIEITESEYNARIAELEDSLTIYDENYPGWQYIQ